MFACGAALAACDLASNGVAAEDAGGDASAEASEASSSDATDELVDGAGDDAASDAPDADAGPDALVDAGSYHCGAGFVSSCINCAGMKALCVDTCVASCHDSCPASQVECFACSATNTPSNSVCVTAANAASCFTLPNVRCTCASTDAGECPGASQVCNAGLCLNCGESSPVNTDNLVCRLGTGSHRCDNGSGGSKLTCH